MQPVGVMRGPPFGEWCDLVYRLFSCCPMNAWWRKTCWASEVRVDCSIDGAAVKNSYNRFWIWLCALLYQSARASRIIFFFRALHMAACMEIFLEGCSLPLSMVSACCLNPLLKKISLIVFFQTVFLGVNIQPWYFSKTKGLISSPKMQPVYLENSILPISGSPPSICADPLHYLSYRISAMSFLYAAIIHHQIPP